MRVASTLLVNFMFETEQVTQIKYTQYKSATISEKLYQFIVDTFILIISHLYVVLYNQNSIM